MMVAHGEKAGFVVPECISLQEHYIRTLRTWADTLEAQKVPVLEVTTEEVYDRYMKYLRGCQHYFTDEMIDRNLVTYLKLGAVA
jgi:cyclopropane-fatty-acyl-phospholipid synthase